MKEKLIKKWMWVKCSAEVVSTKLYHHWGTVLNYGRVLDQNKVIPKIYSVRKGDKFKTMYNLNLPETQSHNFHLLEEQLVTKNGRTNSYYNSMRDYDENLFQTNAYSAYYPFLLAMSLTVLCYSFVNYMWGGALSADLFEEYYYDAYYMQNLDDWDILDHVNRCPVKSRMQFPLWLVISFWILASWFDSIKFESLQGYHTKKVNKDYILGFILFLLSEAMFFFSIFWAFCHFTLSSSLEFAFIWPPAGIEQIDYFQLPLINTMLLVVSGLFVTVSHNFLKKEDFVNTAVNLIITIFLGLGFLCVQWHEYMNISFNINDSVVGSIFYFGTGFHGLHVLLGLIALIYNFFKLYNRELSKERHYSFLFAVWYWHFVDIIWIALYILFYVWGLQW